MTNSANHCEWDDFMLVMPPLSTVTEEPFPLNSQPLDQTSFTDAEKLADALEYFSSSEGTAPSPAADSLRRPNIQKSPSKALNNTLPPSRWSSQLYVSRSDFSRAIRAITEKLNMCEESIREMQTVLQTVSDANGEISVWTVDMNSALENLAQQVVENIGAPIAEMNKWDMPEEEKL